MNKQQIKAELRRSACEDQRPGYYINTIAFYAAGKFVCYEKNEWISELPPEIQRIFFLLAAEAL